MDSDLDGLEMLPSNRTGFIDLRKIDIEVGPSKGKAEFGRGLQRHSGKHSRLVAVVFCRHACLQKLLE